MLTLWKPFTFCQQGKPAAWNGGAKPAPAPQQPPRAATWRASSAPAPPAASNGRAAAAATNSSGGDDDAGSGASLSPGFRCAAAGAPDASALPTELILITVTQPTADLALLAAVARLTDLLDQQHFTLCHQAVFHTLHSVAVDSAKLTCGGSLLCPGSGAVGRCRCCGAAMTSRSWSSS